MERTFLIEAIGEKQLPFCRHHGQDKVPLKKSLLEKILSCRVISPRGGECMYMHDTWQDLQGWGVEWSSATVLMTRMAGDGKEHREGKWVMQRTMMQRSMMQRVFGSGFLNSPALHNELMSKPRWCDGMECGMASTGNRIKGPNQAFQGLADPVFAAGWLQPSVWHLPLSWTELGTVFRPAD